jgi:hypothetical protein
VVDGAGGIVEGCKDGGGKEDVFGKTVDGIFAGLMVGDATGVDVCVRVGRIYVFSETADIERVGVGVLVGESMDPNSGATSSPFDSCPNGCSEDDWSE